MNQAIFGGGCFWCVEAVFVRVQGVQSVESGYAGGQTQNPTYKDICTGTTGHAEVCRITYDESVISYRELLSIFFRTHDATTLNRQGNDVGTQYRSVIYFATPEEEQIARDLVRELDEAGVFPNPIVTEISPVPTFYKAESYHQDYYANNASQPYCMFVVAPKVEKFMKQFGSRAKPQ